MGMCYCIRLENTNYILKVFRLKCGCTQLRVDIRMCHFLKIN